MERTDSRVAESADVAKSDAPSSIDGEDSDEPTGPLAEALAAESEEEFEEACFAVEKGLALDWFPCFASAAAGALQGST